MRKLGIVGGLGPESTLLYYKNIMDQYLKKSKSGEFPEIIIESVNIFEMLRYLQNQDFEGLTEFITRAVKNLYEGGANFAVIASNTPHIVFERVQEISPIPLISIVEEAFLRIQKIGIQKIGLIGTATTMRNHFYQDVFQGSNIDLVIPNEDEILYVDNKIFSELEYGVVKDETKKHFLQILDRMRNEEGVQGFILGCTELPLIIKEDDMETIFFNTTEIHIESIIYKLLEPELES